MKKYKTNKILGLITICINILLFFKSLYLLFVYNFTDRLFLFMYPNWVLLINALLGIIGAYIALLLFKNMIGIKLFLIVTLVLWFISLSNYFYGINLFIGYGAGAYSSLNISSLVSFYVGILLNTGILGILLYSLFIITQARMIFRIEELRFKAAFFMSFVIATTHYLFVDNIYVSWYWIMLSLAYCFYKYNFNQLDLK